ncbi:MAG: peptidoglycan-associated lipoprotein Pal [Nitrospirota bacterium]
MLALTMTGCPKTPKTATQVAHPAEVTVSSAAPPVAEEVSRPPVAAKEREHKAPAEVTLPEMLEDVYFDFDRSDITLVARAKLEHMAEWLLQNPGKAVRIEGHADERGTNEYNLALGERRAQAVKRVLVALDVAEERLSTVSYGEEQPVCRAREESCFHKNRRAHFAVESP